MQCDELQSLPTSSLVTLEAVLVKLLQRSGTTECVCLVLQVSRVTGPQSAAGQPESRESHGVAPVQTAAGLTQTGPVHVPQIHMLKFQLPGEVSGGIGVWGGDGVVSRISALQESLAAFSLCSLLC